MTDRTCLVCAAALTGRQTKYCSESCKRRARAPQKALENARARWKYRDVESLCAQCGKEFLGRRGEKNRFCSHRCTVASLRVPKPQFRQLQLHFPRPMGPLRLAYESGWNQQVVKILLERTEESHGGCRLWPRQTDRDGYPRVTINEKHIPVHRLVAQMIHGDIGISPVHHKCGNRLCIAADHLQVVTPIENTAEMLERRGLQERIAELEAEVARLQASEERRLAS